MRLTAGAGTLACLVLLGACARERETAGAPVSADSGAARKPDTGRAGEIARAPRRDATAPPPGVTLTPERPDTTPPPARPPPPPLRDPYHLPPRDTVSQTVYTGWKYFNLNCARCHGEDATGTTIAPYLIDSFRSGKVDRDEFWRVVRGSRAEKGMPNWTGIVDDDKLGAIYEYLKARSEGKVHPGRPAVAGG